MMNFQELALKIFAKMHLGNINTLSMLEVCTTAELAIKNSKMSAEITNAQTRDMCPTSENSARAGNLQLANKLPENRT